MNDWVKSGIGGESTDKVIQGISTKPSWLTTPLPLSQVDSQAPSLRTGSFTNLPTLQSSCLSTISKNFHLFNASSFSTLPLELARKIIYRIAVERGYDFNPTPTTRRNGASEPNEVAEEENGDGPSESSRPDAATLWALSSTIDPEMHVPNDEYITLSSDHIIPLPILETIHTLPPNIENQGHCHPLIEIPRTFEEYQRSKITGESSGSHRSSEGSIPPSIGSRSHFELLTTLSLDGARAPIDDSNIGNLRWCTHLTVVWMSGCSVTDSGIRLLATSLELPGAQLNSLTRPQNATPGGPSSQAPGKGLCRLRAWFLPGCKKVTDKSMRAFAKWPGLVLLDLRNTSCTESAKQVFNTQSRLLFNCSNPDFQPCTDGLKQLFSSLNSSAQILDALCQTLIRPRRYISNDLDASEKRWWLGLHVIPSQGLPLPEWLPDPYMPTKVDYNRDKYSTKRTYRGDGVGQIYGQGVAYMKNDVSSYRYRLKTATKMQSMEEGLMKWEEPWWSKKKLTHKEKIHKRKLEENPLWKAPEQKKLEKGYKESDYIKGGRGGGMMRVTRGRGRGRGRGGGGATGGRDVGDGAEEADERSKFFVKGGRGADKAYIEEVIQGDPHLMLVRMVSEEWESLTWSNVVMANSSASSSNISMAAKSGLFSASQGTSKRLDGNLVNNILGSSSQTFKRPITSLDQHPLSQACRSSSPLQSSPPPDLDFDFIHSASTSIQASSTSQSSFAVSSSQNTSSGWPFSQRIKAEMSDTPRPIPKSTNPFKQKTPTQRSQLGVRPLGGKLSCTPSLSNGHSSDRGSSDPVTPTTSSPTDSTHVKVESQRPEIQSTLSFGDDLSFDTKSTKRRFGGAEPEEKKRKGMKLFNPNLSR